MLPTITIDGRLVADPELRFTGGGKAACNMRVAASDSKKDDAGNWQTTEQVFINVTLWDADAEAAAEHYAKGDRVLVTGRIYERQYDKRDGNKGSALEVKFPTVAKVPRAQQKQPQQAQQQAPTNDPWGSAGNDAPPF